MVYFLSAIYKSELPAFKYFCKYIEKEPMDKETEEYLKKNFPKTFY